MIKKDHDEIWYWYKKIEEFHESGIPPKEYCTEYEIDYKKFSNMRYRIEYKSRTHPDLYQSLIPLTRKYMKSGIPASKFAKENKVDVRVLSEMVTHLGYTDIIEKLKSEEEVKPMQFIQVPPVQPRPPAGYREPMADAEVVEKQNDLEIIISKGVKVSISPNIDSMKIIKIIELLKDL